YPCRVSPAPQSGECLFEFLQVPAEDIPPALPHRRHRLQNRRGSILPLPPEVIQQDHCILAPTWRGHSCLPCRHSCLALFAASHHHIPGRVFDYWMGQTLVPLVSI